MGIQTEEWIDDTSRGSSQSSSHLDHGPATYHLALPHRHLHLVCRGCRSVLEVPTEAADALVARVLSETGFRAGCPVVAVAVEADNPPVIERAAAAFTRWLTQLEAQLRADGASAGQAAELAMLATTAIEGAVLVARTTASSTPLDLVHRQLRALVTAALTQRKASS